MVQTKADSPARGIIGTHLVELGTDVRIVQALLGHSSIHSTVLVRANEHMNAAAGVDRVQTACGR